MPSTTATPAKSDDPNDVVLTMKESSALIYHLTGLRWLIHRPLLSQAFAERHFMKFGVFLRLTRRGDVIKINFNSVFNGCISDLSLIPLEGHQAVHER
jgi:hypothetical protein